MHVLWWLPLLLTSAVADAGPTASPWPGTGPLLLPNSSPFHAIFLDAPLVEPRLPSKPRLELFVTHATSMALSPNVLSTPAGQALIANWQARRPQTALDHAGLASAARAAPGQSFLFADTETSRVTLAARVPLSRRWGVSAELPVVAHWGGLFDQVVKGWHRALGFGDLGRSFAPLGRTQIFFARGDQSRFLDGSPQPDLGDLVVRGLYSPWRETRTRPAALLGASVKAPTGAASRFVGSGGWDAGLLGSVGKSWGAWRLLAGGGYTWHGRWAGFSGVPLSPSADGHLALECRLDRRWSLLGQFSYQEHALARAARDTFGRGSLRLGLGGHYQVDDGLLMELAFSENLREDQSTEDIGIQGGVHWTPW
jgi:hypothetical protein